jgi:hypothetical protein
LNFALDTQEPQELYKVLLMIKRFECVDVRDKLYGVLALVDWQGNSRPNPDYSKDNFQVFVDALRLVTMCEFSRNSFQCGLEPKTYSESLA